MVCLGVLSELLFELLHTLFVFLLIKCHRVAQGFDLRLELEHLLFGVATTK